MIRERLPRATIITFWHIPWPNAERFGICPVGERAARGHARLEHRRLPHPAPLQQLHRGGRPLPRGAHRSRAAVGGPRAGARRWCGRTRSRSSGRTAGRRTRRRWRSAGARCAPSSASRRTRSSASASTASTTRRASRSASSRSSALLERFPHLRGRFTFVQLAAPSRTLIPQYRRARTSGSRRSRRASTRGSPRARWRPIVLLRAHHEPPDGLPLPPRRRRLLRVEPPRRHEPRREGVRRGARRRARRARAVALHRGGARAHRGAAREPVRPRGGERAPSRPRSRCPPTSRRSACARCAPSCRTSTSTAGRGGCSPTPRGCGSATGSRAASPRGSAPSRRGRGERMRPILSEDARGTLEALARERALLVFDFDGTLAPHRRPARGGGHARVAPGRSSGWRRSSTRARSSRGGRGPTSAPASRASRSSRSWGTTAPRRGSGRSTGAARPHRRGLGARALRAALAEHAGESRSRTRGSPWRSTTGAPPIPGPPRRGRAPPRRALAGARVFGGTRVVNVVPAGAPDKGAAVVELLAPDRRRTALYVGDDVTDEDAFAAEAVVVPVRVGPSPTVGRALLPARAGGRGRAPARARLRPPPRRRPRRVRGLPRPRAAAPDAGRGAPRPGRPIRLNRQLSPETSPRSMKRKSAPSAPPPASGAPAAPPIFKVIVAPVQAFFRLEAASGLVLLGAAAARPRVGEPRRRRELPRLRRRASRGAARPGRRRVHAARPRERRPHDALLLRRGDGDQARARPRRAPHPARRRRSPSSRRSAAWSCPRRIYLAFNAGGARAAGVGHPDGDGHRLRHRRPHAPRAAGAPRARRVRDRARHLRRHRRDPRHRDLLRARALDPLARRGGRRLGRPRPARALAAVRSGLAWALAGGAPAGSPSTTAGSTRPSRAWWLGLAVPARAPDRAAARDRRPRHPRSPRSPPAPTTSLDGEEIRAIERALEVREAPLDALHLHPPPLGGLRRSCRCSPSSTPASRSRPLARAAHRSGRGGDRRRVVRREARRDLRVHGRQREARPRADARRGVVGEAPRRVPRAGIGFTVALFIAGLAFPDDAAAARPGQGRDPRRLLRRRDRGRARAARHPSGPALIGAPGTTAVPADARPALEGRSPGPGAVATLDA